ncbi:MAG: hypothetical protein K2P58_03255 [Hyphomonadaceae bacterium]|nr:hypothetical protein [Hyphomonadaceae bacterium]
MKRGPSKFWAALFRAGVVRGRLPFWRVVIEARLNRHARRWPRRFGSAVTAVFVWARTIEEAEGLASLAAEEEGLEVLTADAKQCPPAAAPKRVPMAVSRTELGFLPQVDGEAGARRDARA